MIDRSLTTALDSLFSEWEGSTSPGCALGLIRAGELVHEREYGMADLEHGVAIDASSVFYIASTSKQFTAASVLLLVRDGIIALDDDIRRLIPEIPDYGRPITIGNLVYQTSGLRDYLELVIYAGGSQEDEFDNATVVRWLSRQPTLNFPTGSKYEYSNSNYALMADIVRRASGRTLRVFAEERIFGPLGMTSTHFDDDHREVIPGRVVSYERTGPGEFRQFLKGIDTVGDGNLLTTVRDLARWDRDYYDETVGGPGFSAWATTRGTLDDGTEIPYSAGLFTSEHRGLPVVMHGGGFLGFRTQLIRFPEQRMSVVLLANLAEFDAGGLASRVADLWLEHEGVPLASAPAVTAEPESSEAPAPTAATTAEVTTSALSSAELAEFAGDYRSADLDAVRGVVLEDGRLRMELRRLPGLLEPVGVDGFRIPELDARLDFSRDPAGRITGFDVRSTRIPALRFDRV